MGKPVTLTKEEYKIVFEKAHENFMNRSHTGKTFLCECIIEAFLTLTASKNYVISNGNIYSEDKKTKI